MLFPQLTAHEIVDDGIDGTVCVAQPMRDQRQGGYCFILARLKGASEKFTRTTHRNKYMPQTNAISLNTTSPHHCRVHTAKC